MELLSPLRLSGRSVGYRRLASSVSALHDFNQEFVGRMERGEADPQDDPFRLSPKELKLWEGYATSRQTDHGDQQEEDIPTASAWRDED